MKRLIVCLILTLLLVLTVTSCESEDTIDEPQELSGPWVLVDTLKDNGLVYQKIYYNTESELTYVYNYYWTTSDRTGYDNIQKTTVIVYDNDGNIINNIEE